MTTPRLPAAPAGARRRRPRILGLPALLTLAAAPLAAQEPAPWQEPEFSFGGQFRVMANANNVGFHPISVPADPEAEAFVNQRFRPDFGVRTNEEVSAWMQLEFGHIPWGQDFEQTKTFTGPRFPGAADPTGDRVGVELRRAWIRYEPGERSRWTAGIQGWSDRFGALLADAEWAFQPGGLVWQGGSEVWDLRASALSLWEGDTRVADDAVLAGLDADRRLGSNSLGASLYYLWDGGSYTWPTLPAYDNAWDLWGGLRWSREAGEGLWQAWAVLNHGVREDAGVPAARHTGLAAALRRTGLPLGGGFLDFQALGSSGDDSPAADGASTFRTIAQSARDGLGAQGYWSWLVVSSPNGPSDVADLGLGLQNQGAGLLTLQARYRQPLGSSVEAALAAGWLRAAADLPSGSADLGFETAGSLGFDLGGGLRLEVAAGWLFAGDGLAATGGPAPGDLWEVSARLQLEF